MNISNESVFPKHGKPLWNNYIFTQKNLERLHLIGPALNTLYSCCLFNLEFQKKKKVFFYKTTLLGRRVWRKHVL